MTRFPVAVRPLERLAAIQGPSHPPARPQPGRSPHSAIPPHANPLTPPINNPRRNPP